MARPGARFGERVVGADGRGETASGVAAPSPCSLFQWMIFAALLERVLPNAGRLAVASVLLIGSIFIADHFGLVALIARGYRALAWIFLAVYVLPLMTWGLWLLWRGSVHPATEPPTRTVVPASRNLPER